MLTILIILLKSLDFIVIFLLDFKETNIHNSVHVQLMINKSFLKSLLANNVLFKLKLALND